MLVPYLITVSLATLVATYYVWSATNSRSSLIGGLFGGIALLAAAGIVSGGGAAQQADMAIGLPLLAGMLFLGRAFGSWMRVHKETALRQPTEVWTVLGTLCVTGAAWIYQTIMAH
jgi:hypothetical protein